MEQIRKYAVDDVVKLDPDTSGLGVDYGTVIDLVGSDGTPDFDGDGPLYLVNAGNVFGHGGMWERVLPESRLLALIESHRKRAAAAIIAEKIRSGELVKLAHGGLVKTDEYDPARHGPAAQ